MGINLSPHILANLTSLIIESLPSSCVNHRVISIIYREESSNKNPTKTHARKLLDVRLHPV